MKKRKIFYSLATLGVIAILAGVISYATPTRSTQPPVQQIQSDTSSPEATATETVKKKPCDCCKERIARLQEQIRKARERRQAAQATETQALVSEQSP